MDGAFQPNQSHQTMVGLGSNNSLKCGIPNDDQCFLLYFIMGTYFGPDIKGQSSKKSVLQRIAEGLPPYTHDQLTGSFMKRVELERVYYYLLRKVDKSLVVTLPSLRRYFECNDISGQMQYGAANYPLFLDLFPPELHPQSRFKNRCKIIDNIVFVNILETFYIKPEDVERFKRLSGLEDFRVDIDAAGLNAALGDNVPYNMSMGKDEPNGNMPTIKSCSSSQKARSLDEFSEYQDPLQHVHVIAPISSVPYNGTTTNMMYSYMAPLPPEDADEVGPAMLFLPSRPTRKEWSEIVAATKNGFALTGTAAMGQVGPIIGLMDIGECEDSYLFRVSLPGVKRDEKEFSCEVDTEGKVFIRGITTTGEKTVSRYSQVFEMKTQNLCPPGHFSITFQLPGPVDPHQFSGNFGTDGILEGIVMKGKRT